MPNVDTEALIDANKALGIIFIVTIAISALILLAKLFRRLQNNANDIRLITVSIITCGTILISLFFLLVPVRLLFESIDISCRSLVLASVYGENYFPFVYALSLIAIAIELCAAKRGYHFVQSTPVRMMYAIFPWIIGCVIVLPLTLSGMDWDGCTRMFNLSRLRAIVWISQLLPALVVFILTFIVLKVIGIFHKQPNNATVAYNNNNNNNNNPPSGLVVSPASPGVFHQTPNNSHVMTPMYESQDNQQAYNNQPPHYPSSTTDIKPQEHNQHHPQPQPQYSSPVPPPPNYYYPNPPPGPVTIQTPGFMQQPTPPCQNSHQQPAIGLPVGGAPCIPVSRDFRMEATAFNVSASPFIVCTLAKAIYTLAYTYNKDRIYLDPLNHTIGEQFIYWFDVLKWLLLNMSWVSYIK